MGGSLKHEYLGGQKSKDTLNTSSTRNRTAPRILEVRRCDLAETFGCVPSQINYVLATRFTPEKGYLIESRRGGGGYIRITRAKVQHGLASPSAYYRQIGRRVERKEEAELIIHVS